MNPGVGLFTLQIDCGVTAPLFYCQDLVLMVMLGKVWSEVGPRQYAKTTKERILFQGLKWG